MTRHMNPELFCDETEKLLARLKDHTQIGFALECALRVARFWHAFDSTDTCIDSGLEATQNWLSGKSTLDKLRQQNELVQRAQERASDEYDRIEGMRDLRDASPAGVVAFQANHAASAASHVLLAVLDEQCRTYACASAVTLAWTAALFDESEAAWQLARLSELTSIAEKEE